MKLMNWNEANEFISKMNGQEFAGHSDWRLPTVNELINLIDYESKESIANQLIAYGYKGVQVSRYWSSTGYDSYTDGVWVVSMNAGGVGGRSKTYDCRVWPVRGELEFLKDLTSLDLVK